MTITRAPGRVAIFATCFNDTMFPDAPKATVRLLRRLGVDVEFPPGQTCCGQMFTNTGYAPDALGLVKQYVELFSRYDHVVLPSGSCTGSIREQHHMIAVRSGDTGLTREVSTIAPRALELSEFLVDVLGVEDVGASFPHSVTYHPTCHSLRMLRVGDKPLRLLRNVRGIDLRELPAAEQCCGFGGTFSVKNPDVSVAMGSDKARHVAETGAQYVVAGDNSCLAHIGGLLHRDRTGIKTIHLAEILASTEEDRA